YDGGRGGLPKDPQKARSAYQRACDGGRAYGCINLGWLYINGRGGEQDDKRAAELLDQACRIGDKCSSKGWALLTGRGVPRDTAAGTELLRKECASGNDWSCQQLATHGIPRQAP